jgi:hypothetical protein
MEHEDEDVLRAIRRTRERLASAQLRRDLNRNRARADEGAHRYACAVVVGPFDPRGTRRVGGLFDHPPPGACPGERHGNGTRQQKPWQHLRS